VRLRLILIQVCLALLVTSVLLIVFVNGAFVQLTILSAVALAGLSFEARRYTRQFKDAGTRKWQLTDEKFIDPESGHLMQVRFDPVTGDRDYVDLGPSSSAG
jgi:hypothetical protein